LARIVMAEDASIRVAQTPRARPESPYIATGFFIAGETVSHES
jgi:hypothetical protein